MWFWLALGSAVLGAIDLILNKKLVHRVSPALLSWALFTLPLPIMIPFAMLSGIPAINTLFLIGVIGSSLTFVFAKTLFNGALKNNIVSQILPLTAFAGLFSYIFGLILLSESLRFIPVLGLVAIVAGAYILNADQAREDIFRPFKLLFNTRGALLLLASIILGSLTVILDKMGVINTFPKNPIFVIICEQVIQSAFMTGYLIKKEGRIWIPSLKRNFNLLFLNSLLYLAISFLVLYAYIDGPAALVTGIKRLQIFIALTLGIIFLKDKPTKHAWIATIIMILGVLMIKLG